MANPSVERERGQRRSISQVTPQHLHWILPSPLAVNAEMALRLGRFCGNGPDLWLRMQQAHDLWRAREQLRGELDQIPQHAAR